MTEVYSNPDSSIVGFLKSELDAAGISCYIRNQNTNTMMTGIPSVLFWPVLCITDDEDIEDAKSIVAAFMAMRKKADLDSPEWVCQKCGQAVPATFSVCWNCEAPKPD